MHIIFLNDFTSPEAYLNWMQSRSVDRLPDHPCLTIPSLPVRPSSRAEISFSCHLAPETQFRDGGDRGKWTEEYRLFDRDTRIYEWSGSQLPGKKIHCRRQDEEKCTTLYTSLLVGSALSGVPWSDWLLGIRWLPSNDSNSTVVLNCILSVHPRFSILYC